MNVQQVSFDVLAPTYRVLEEKGAFLDLQPNEYARRLFQAGFASRTAIDRGESSGDADLDNQVRLVFLLADCEAEYIAEATGVPQPLVERILEGWRQAAKHIVSGDAHHRITGGAALSATATENGVTARRDGNLPSRGWTKPTVDKIRKMWAAGKTNREIGNAVGRTAKSIEHFASRNRSICPARRS